MTKRQWYLLGLIISIFMFISFFIISLNILSLGHEVLFKASQESVIAAYLYGMSNYYIYGDMYPLLILNLINLFWIGIVIFGVLLSKTKIGK